MNKDDLIKLAEIAGVDWFESKDENGAPDGQGVYFNNPDHSNFYQWQPHKDIAQAFEVLEGWRSSDDLRNYMISSPKQQACIKFYDLDLYCYDSDGFIYTVKGEHEVLSEAICQAVLKAQGEG